jgi:hypothetical protein
MQIKNKNSILRTKFIFGVRILFTLRSFKPNVFLHQ